MRTGISITLKPADRRLAALARDRNAPHKHVWRAEIVLLSADGVGTNEIMRQTGAENQKLGMRAFHPEDKARPAITRVHRMRLADPVAR